MISKDNLKAFLWVALAIVGFMLYTNWQKEHAAEEKFKKEIKANAKSQKQKQKHDDIPDVVERKQEKKVFEEEVVIVKRKKIEKKHKRNKEEIVNVKTDVFALEIDLNGGDIIKLDLLKYPQTINEPQGFSLFDVSSDRFYIAQSGLLNKFGPDSKDFGRALYKADKLSYGLKGETLNIDLFYKTKTNVYIVKRFIFNKGSYLINVEYFINNRGSIPYRANFFGRLKRKPTAKSSGFMGAMRTYTGAAVNTIEKTFKKISFDDMKKKPFNETRVAGWASMVEHYFASAWIPESSRKHTYSSEVFKENKYGIRFVSEAVTVLPGEETKIGAGLYAGPEVTDILKKVSEGLELTVDYGILWPICQPIFWILKTIQKFVVNWGFAIILTTIFIKLLFFKLSASSYRSMGNMRKLQPKIDDLKKRYGGDRQAFGKAVMTLYKQEKVNPLGGCLPILIQIPVFIALYYVLLESVELRQAPFMLWINDLSAKDPFYVLPIIMGVSMIVQQKLSPAPPDPMQAKVMMMMPIVFTFLFLQFPAGLVLYWVVNNSLSILQQWIITKKIVSKK